MLNGAAIEVVPLTIRFGDEEFVDRRDLDPRGFWDKLTAQAGLPETAAPSAGAFLDAYRLAADQGADGALAICLSGAVSATYQAAVIAAEQASLPVKVLDSRSVTMGLGLQVLAAAADARTGMTLDGAAAAAADRVGRTHLFAALDTLEFLRRGGRVGGAQALIGGLLDIKPLIDFDGGAVRAAGRVRTRGKALQAIVDKAVGLAPRLRALAVFHGHAPDADHLVARLEEAIPGHTAVVTLLGPVVGTHAGPGAIGIGYLLD
jgi:DegV family protein with EDD domain